jgi:hypothetical protein
MKPASRPGSIEFDIGVPGLPETAYNRAVPERLDQSLLAAALERLEGVKPSRSDRTTNVGS